MRNCKQLLALIYAIILCLSCTYCLAEEDTVTVPYLIGMDVKDATELLDKEGLNHTELFFHNDITEENTVFMQNPNENEALPKGSTIMLSVSAGPEQVTVPDLLGKNIDEATELVKNAGLYPIRERVTGEASAVDTVISQNPAANEKVDKKTDILLLYGNGETSAPLTAAGSGDDSTFYEIGLEVADVLNEMLQNKDFMDLFITSGSNREMLDKMFNTGDYDKPIAVYRLNQVDIMGWLKTIMSEDDLDKFNSFSPVLQEQLLSRVKGVTYLANNINAQKGMDIYAFASALQPTLSKTDLEKEEPEYYLFVYEKGIPVVVSLGWHRAAGMFLVLSEEETESLESIQAMLKPLGLEISPVEIPQAETADK